VGDLPIQETRNLKADGKASFDPIAEEYESGRPSYPEAVYDALEPLEGMQVLEGGAGTGIATASLVERGARVVAFDVSGNMIRRAMQRIPGLMAIVADGSVLPIRDRSADLICFAQAWHWLDATRRCPEAARVLRTGGRWAGWWSHARADGEPWFDAYWDAIEASCPGVLRSQRDTDWGTDVRRSGLFKVGKRIEIAWMRRVSVETWLIEESSKSYIAGLGTEERDDVLRKVEGFAMDAFVDGAMTVPYETWLWTAEKRR
jgi:SAM-dependent methyltransferase